MTLFFYGPNSYAMRKQLSQMVNAYLDKAGSDFGLVRIDGQEARLQELSAALRASPFLATSRLVIVEGILANKVLAGGIPELLGLVPETTVAVFVETEVDMRTAAFKALSKADRTVKFETLSGQSLLGWIAQEVRRLGGSIEGGTARELVELAGSDQWRLSEEINKLVNYSLAVTEEHVRLLVSPTIERSIFKLVESMTSGRTESALADYHGLLRQKESEMYVLTMIQWHLRNLLFAKSAPASMSPTELAKVAGISPYVADKAAAAQRKLSIDELKSAFSASADCERDIKTGRLAGEPAVERLIYRVAAEAKANQYPAS